MGNRDETDNTMQSTVSQHYVESPPKSTLLQPALLLIMAATLILGIWVRLTGIGWNILLWGIPLLLLATFHCWFQVKAIHRVPKMEPEYILLILLSNLFLFLGFTLQVDSSDAPGSYVAILIFYEKYFKHGSWEYIPDRQSTFYMYAK
jgi:hypothetical protein